jgi:ABC-type glycerol-3-phosphate transport system permease component
MGFNTFVGSVGSGAGSILMLAIPIIVFVVSQSQIIETMASSGMKD